MKSLILILKVLFLSIVHFIVFSLASSLLIPSEIQDALQSENASSAFVLLMICLMNSAIFSFILYNSRITGWRLIAGIFVLFFGVMTFMPQIESAFFIEDLPDGFFPGITSLGAIVAGIFSPLAVWLIKPKEKKTDEGKLELKIYNRKMNWKVMLIAIIYLILYFTFGYFIAWKNPEVREFYSGDDPGNFFMQMRSVLIETPWLVPFQIIRAFLWAALGYLMVFIMRDNWIKVALATALLFSVVMNNQLLLPNPLMPEAVRMVHLVETGISNFIFGFLMIAIFHLTRKNKIAYA
ncbi:hypothetical protein BH23BAC1_BH23BAC1_03180 [soil metagenome]